MADVGRAFELHKDAVYRLALSYTGNPVQAEDICQSAFMKLVERSRSIPQEKVKAWLLRVTANLCKDYLRSFWVRNILPLEQDTQAKENEITDVWEAVMELKPKERAVVYLYYYEGYSTAQIGTMLGTTQTAVSTRLNRARNHLKARLEESV